MRRNKNRICTKRSAGIKGSSLWLPAFIVAFVATCLVYIAADRRGSQQQTALAAQENELNALNEECERERVKWDVMTSPKNLDRALLRHGLVMERPRSDQIVRLAKDGRPRPGQLSVAKINTERSRAGMVASNTRRRAGAR